MKKLLTIAALTASTFTAQADVRINGFANFIGGIASSDETLYGYDDTISFSEESLFAIQISGDINEKMTATGQLVARGENDYSPDFEWAYLSYAATDSLSINVGRFRVPLFNYSSSMDVGYSYHWITVPNTVYNVPFNNLDGIRVDYSNYVGDWEYNLALSMGTFSGVAESLAAEASGDNVILISGEAVYDWFKFRAVAGTAKTTIDLATSTNSDINSLNSGFNALSSVGFASLENDLQISNDTGEFYGLSVQIDKFDWFVNAEVVSISVEDSFFVDEETYYLTAGIRTGAWTPSITYEKSKSTPELKFTDQIANLSSLVALGVPEETVNGLTAAALGSQLSQEADEDIWTVAIKYDYASNIALKADISKYSDGVDESSDATLVRFALNYIF
jgi:hypothetical protein